MTVDLKETRHDHQLDTVYTYLKSHKLIEMDGNVLIWKESNENMLLFSCETCRIFQNAAV